MYSGKRIFVKGIVQGVGFRPFIYKLALDHHLTGWVRNTSGGVEIEVNGFAANLDEFALGVASNPPPQARIDHVAMHDCEPDGYSNFTILSSEVDKQAFMPVSPDLSVCPDCLRELFDPSERRYRYPFINCTNCGPRFSIIRDIPYDRKQTTMAAFKMCPDCSGEYENPLDRRFHAQPAACPACGPHLTLLSQGKVITEKEDALQETRRQLKAGKIVAVKGLGGYHLACDAFNPSAVETLRARKLRHAKPFALMAASVEVIRKHCMVSPLEAELLASTPNPILLLFMQPGSAIAAGIAPGQKTLGFMLPYTPLHFLLLEPEEGFPEALVMTSGNLSEEPIVFEDKYAIEKLAPLADFILTHDREIHERLDDSIFFVTGEAAFPIRRSRGFSPDPLRTPKPLPQIFGAGADLKNTFTLTRGEYAFTSHFIGDLENYETTTSYETSIQRYEHLFKIKPEYIACDLHPDYYSTRYAQKRSHDDRLPIIQVQHHHAHLAACLADNDWNYDEPVIGLIFDGTGLGTDDAIWGGEVLLGGYSGYERVYHLKYVPLPGGDLSVRKPARMALTHLWSAGIDWDGSLPPARHLCFEERTALRLQLEKNLNSRPTSSMGRLFDAVSSLIGICHEVTYEGQAAIELEALAEPTEKGAYRFEIEGNEINPKKMWSQLLNDHSQGIPASILAARFQNGLVNLLRQVCDQLRVRHGCQTVALSGGVWQNRVLTGKSIAALKQDGFTVLAHKTVPPNDGCISLGQVMAAAAFIEKSNHLLK
ncbi:MAG: carbamoyltransferase HypF [Anaerolineaceae bacterium]